MKEKSSADKETIRAEPSRVERQKESPEGINLKAGARAAPRVPLSSIRMQRVAAVQCNAEGARSNDNSN